MGFWKNLLAFTFGNNSPAEGHTYERNRRRSKIERRKRHQAIPLGRCAKTWVLVTKEGGFVSWSKPVVANTKSEARSALKAQYCVWQGLALSAAKRLRLSPFTQVIAA